MRKLLSGIGIAGLAGAMLGLMGCAGIMPAGVIYNDVALPTIANSNSQAKKVGVSYSKAKLTSDPAYNTTLGAQFLGDLIDRFNGSYVMTFAAYNAGPSRVARWIETFGDPRDPNIDVVNWIEFIPFTETRNYVQRIMENMQVYRARLGSPALTIEGDLKRGGRR